LSARANLNAVICRTSFPAPQEKDFDESILDPIRNIVKTDLRSSKARASSFNLNVTYKKRKKKGESYRILRLNLAPNTIAPKMTIAYAKSGANNCSVLAGRISPPTVLAAPVEKLHM
jgi:hypothetical protein